jgi:hypothetical protein
LGPVSFTSITHVGIVDNPPRITVLTNDGVCLEQQGGSDLSS